VSDKRISLGFAGLSGVRSAGLEPATFWFVVILLHGQGGTLGDRERQNRTFIEYLGLFRDTEGQGETPDCGQIAVRNLELFRWTLEPEAAEGYEKASSRQLDE
jgi:hypothetical protein